MRVISIDPGFDRVGVAILEQINGSNPVLVFSECITTNKKDSFISRIFFVCQRVSEIIAEFNPSFFAIENLFFTTNKKTAMRVSEARGALLYISQVCNLIVYEYTPIEIKVAITGYGKATKEDIFFMTKKLIPILEKKEYGDDEIDAIAVGLTFFARYKIDSLLSTKK